MSTQAPDDTVAGSDEVADRISDLIRDRLHIEVPSPDTDLFATGLIDSLGFVELLLGLQQDLGIEVDVDSMDMDDFSSIERITAFVIRHQRASHNAG